MSIWIVATVDAWHRSNHHSVRRDGCIRNMNDKTRLQAELRAVREELVHRDLKSRVTNNASLLCPPIDIEFARLTCLTDEQLKQHEDRLERDLQDTKLENPRQLYRPTDNDEPLASK